jgi:hypothetical protein
LAVRKALSFFVLTTIAMVSPALANDATNTSTTETYVERAAPAVDASSTITPEAPLARLLSNATVPSAEPATTSASAAAPTQIKFRSPARSVDFQKHALLMPLCVSLTGLQFYDAYSTMTGLSRGLAEGNPLMQGVASHAYALIGLKAGTSVATIYAATQLWKQHHRTAALALIGATNGISLMVAAHNAGVVSAAGR